MLDPIAQGCDRVLNLAAGFDTRPYRLALPRALTWIEADLPALIDEKEPPARRRDAGLHAGPRGGRPRRLGRARRASCARAVQGASNALVITEGLVVYLDDATVQALARDLAAEPAIRWWMLDCCRPGSAR